MAALHFAGLIDPDGHWTGTDARLWFLGDLIDRGPDGLGVIELVMRLIEEAPGNVNCLLGNHEILTLGMQRWGETEISLTTGTVSFSRSWMRNGGLLHDLAGVTETHLAWLRRRPLLAIVDDHLLAHSDTLAYLRYGASVDEVTSAVHRVLAGDDPLAWWDVWRRLTTRYAFRGADGESNADAMLSTFGGRRIVHGHSPIPDQLDIDPEESPASYEYCAGKVLNVDSGLVMGGPVPLVRVL